jgi:hypothetical protein
MTEDGLSAFFGSDRPGGFGSGDIYMSTRVTLDDPWGEPVNLGPVVNGLSYEGVPELSPDGRTLLFMSNRPGGYGAFDIWVTTRPTTDDEWGSPANLGPVINTSSFDGAATISADGSAIYFMSGRDGGSGQHDLWEAPINLIVDFNGDGMVDAPDVAAMVDHWHTDDPLYDIGTLMILFMTLPPPHSAMD